MTSFANWKAFGRTTINHLNNAFCFPLHCKVDSAFIHLSRYRKVAPFTRLFSESAAAFVPSNHPRRSVLYMPGSNARAMEKGKTIPADGLILDLEDAVAINAKVWLITSPILIVIGGG